MHIFFDDTQNAYDAKGPTLLLVYQPKLANSVFLDKSSPQFEDASTFYKTYLFSVSI